MTEQAQAFWQEVEREQDYVIELTRELVRISTVNPKFQEDPDLNREADA